MAIQCSKKRWALVLVPLALIVIALIIVGVYFWTRDGNDNDDNATRPEVTIAQGTLRGVNMETYYGRSIFGFKGIPFAQPPVGNLRFAAPVAAGAWEGTLDASSDSNPCPQYVGGGLTGNEDCLYLNVYTPSLPTSANSTLLPVMVYVYGGAFRAGSNAEEDYNPDFLLDKDVILVVPAYRLGVLGFLTTGDEVASGNWGLKDVVRALEWNRDNIQYFGGDPNQVTVFGESAGGTITHLLAFSNLTDGLYHRYIFESGSAYNPPRPTQLLVNRTAVLSQYLGCSDDTSLELVSCLRNMTLTRLIVEPNSLFEVWNGSPNAWGPGIEPDVDGAFITTRPMDLMATGQFHDLPFIASVNRDEGITRALQYMFDPDLFESFLADLDIALPVTLPYGDLVADVTAYTDRLKSFYMNDLTANRTELLTNYTQLMGDALAIYPAHISNQKQLVYSQNSQYLCSFEYRGTFSNTYTQSGSTENYGVAHMDELIYLFQPVYSNVGPEGAVMSEADLQMVETMVQLWTSFAISGTPTTTVGSGNAVIWEQYSSSKSYLRIGNNSDPAIAVQYNIAEERMQFWEEHDAATSWL